MRPRRIPAHRLFRASWALVACLLVAAAQQKPGKKGGSAGIDSGAGQRYAIVVGVSNYGDQSGLAPLQFAAKDATDLSAELISQGYNVRTLINENATGSLIKKALFDLSETVKPNEDQVVFYFSGHGYQQGPKNYLATFGVAAKYIESDGLSVEEVLGTIDSMNLVHAAALIDACRSNPHPSKSGVTPTFQALRKASKTAVLYSTQPSQASFEDPTRQQGVFTRFLLEGMRGAAQDASGRVTMGTMAKYVGDSMQKATFASGNRQSPTLVAMPESLNSVIASPRTERAPLVPSGAPAMPPASNQRLLFASDRIALAYNGTLWETTSEPASDRIELGRRSSRLRAIIAHEDSQTPHERLKEQAIETLGGAAIVQVIEDSSPVRAKLTFTKLLLRKNTIQYIYYFYTGEVGTVREVVWGPATDPAWSQNPGDSLMAGISLAGRR